MKKKPSRWSRIARLLLFSTIALGTLLALAYAALDYMGRRDLARTKEELLARGEKLSLPQLAPPRIPDALNFFAAPIWKKQIAWAESETSGGDPFASAVTLEDGEKWYRAATVGSSFESGRLTDLQALAETLSPDGGGMSVAQRVLNAIAAREPYLPEIEEAAARPSGRYPIAYERNVGVRLSHLWSFTDLAKVLSLRAVTRMAGGDSAGAAGDLALMLKIAGFLKAEPLLISHLVRSSIFVLSVNAFWECTARGTWSEGDLAHLQMAFSRPDPLADFARSLRGERAMINDWFASTGLWNEEWRAMDSMSGDDTTPRSYPGLLGPVFPRGFLLSDVALYNRKLQAAIDLLERGAPDLPALLEALRSEPHSRFTHPLTSVSFPVFVTPALRFFDTADMLRLAATACALERHRLAEGDFPPSLDALVPRFLDAVPVNAATKEPLRYERLSSVDFRLSTPAISTVGWTKRMTHDGNFVWKRQPAAE